MEPIVSPQLIYLINVANALKIAMIVLSIITFISTIFTVSVAGCEDCRNYGWKELGKYIKMLIIVFLVLVLFAILIPNKQTAITMVVAKHVTPNNIESVLKEGKSFKDEVKRDIIDILTLELKDKEEE